MSVDAEPIAPVPRPNPYVGPRSIKFGEPLYGRDHEVDELRDILIAERILLLYSPSGAGKSSLLEAGLRPALESTTFTVLPTIRVGHLFAGADVPGANRYLTSTLASIEEGRPPERRLDPEVLGTLTLDRYLARLAADEPDDDLEVCLFFDQFEELFTLDPTDVHHKLVFMRQLGLALRDRSRWALFAMREDFIAQLDPYLSVIPKRFSARYRLGLLGPAAARIAAQRPAADAGVIFADDAVDRLIDDLRRVRVQRGTGVTDELGPHVEPVQLQVVCHQLWRSMSL